MAGDLYFSRALFKGLGKLYVLKIPQVAGVGSSTRKLLGSYVNEIDRGVWPFKRQIPALNHSWVAEYFLSIASSVPGNPPKLVEEVELSGFTQTVEIEKSLSGEAKAPFPGVPVSLGIEIDYKLLRKAQLTMGSGSKKFYIPRDIVRKAYRHFALEPSKYEDTVFHSDRMLVDQIVIARDVTLEVESRNEFGVDFDAKATAINDIGGGVEYRRVSERTYKVSIKDGRDYLFAIGGVEADEFTD